MRKIGSTGRSLFIAALLVGALLMALPMIVVATGSPDPTIYACVKTSNGDIANDGDVVTDPDDWQEHAGEIPTMEFYELDELGNQFGNWVGPTVECLLAMCRAAGFEPPLICTPEELSSEIEP